MGNAKNLNYRRTVSALAYLAAAYGEVAKLPREVVGDELSAVNVAMGEALAQSTNDSDIAAQIFDDWHMSADLPTRAYETLDAYPPVLVWQGPDSKRDRADVIGKATVFAAAAYDELEELIEHRNVDAEMDAIEAAMQGLVKLAVGEHPEAGLDWKGIYDAWKNGGGDSIYEMLGAHRPTVDFKS